MTLYILNPRRDWLSHEGAFSGLYLATDHGTAMPESCSVSYRRWPLQPQQLLIKKITRRSWQLNVRCHDNNSSSNKTLTFASVISKVYDVPGGFLKDLADDPSLANPRATRSTAITPGRNNETKNRTISSPYQSSLETYRVCFSAVNQIE